MQGIGLWRGDNLNAPVDGVRPNAAFANIIQVANDASSRQHQLTTTVQANLAGLTAPPLLPGAAGPLWDWRRLTFNGQYTLARIMNNTDGAFSPPATGDLISSGGLAATTCEPAERRREQPQIKNFSASVNLTAASGAPYTITTGQDNNGNLIFNDRPAGVGRNSARTAGQWYMNAYFAYTFVFGRSTVAAPPGIGINIPSPGAVPIVTQFTAPPPRYRLQFFLNAFNLTNHANYGGYSGTLTSPFFSEPTLVLNPRKMDVGVNLSF